MGSAPMKINVKNVKIENKKTLFNHFIFRNKGVNPGFSEEQKSGLSN